MALTREKKQKSIEALVREIKKQKSVVFADFSQVASGELFKLRRQLKDSGGNMKVGKKTLVRIAFGRSGVSYWNKIFPHVPGQLALLFGIEDEMVPARLAYQFAKKNEHFKILGGIFESNFVETESVTVLALLPPRQQLLGQLAGSIASPISGFESVLQGNIKGLVTVLSKIKQ